MKEEMSRRRANRIYLLISSYLLGLFTKQTRIEWGSERASVPLFLLPSSHFNYIIIIINLLLKHMEYLLFSISFPLHFILLLPFLWKSICRFVTQIKYVICTAVFYSSFSCINLYIYNIKIYLIDMQNFIYIYWWRYSFICIYIFIILLS